MNREAHSVETPLKHGSRGKIFRQCAERRIYLHLSPLGSSETPHKKSYPERHLKIIAPEKSSDKIQTTIQTMSKDRKPRSFVPVCHYCKKSGHVMSDCWLLQKEREKRPHLTPLFLANLIGIQVTIEQNLVLLRQV